MRYTINAADVIGWYAPDTSGPWCDLCIDDVEGFDRRKEEDSSEGSFTPIFGDSETDCPSHCETCKALIPESLTREGVAHVLDAHLGNPSSPVVREWIDHYDLGRDCPDCGRFVVNGNADDFAADFDHALGCPSQGGDDVAPSLGDLPDLPPYEPSWLWRVEECGYCRWYGGYHAEGCEVRPWRESENLAGPTMRIPFA